MPDHSPSTDERASLAQPSQSSSSLECTSHLGFSLVVSHLWNSNFRQATPRTPEPNFTAFALFDYTVDRLLVFISFCPRAVVDFPYFCV